MNNYLKAGFKRIAMNEKRALTFFTILSMLIFLWFIYYETTHDVKEYVADTILFIILTLIMLALYKRLDLNLSSYAFFVLALFLHNAGAFGWYNISPLSIQWDHITHIVGTFAVTLIIYRFCRRFFTSNRFNNLYIIILIILASLGVGVVIEFYEFAGYFIVGEGAGGLGQGEGDITTELGNSLWLNTMLDLVYNLVGALAALIILGMTGQRKVEAK